MASRESRRQAQLAKTRAEIAGLYERGVACEGDAFSPILLLVGRGTASPLAGAADSALRAALSALGYAPEEWSVLSCELADGASIGDELLRLAIAVLDPATVVALDGAAADCLRSCYASELAELENLDAAMLSPGYVSHVLGMRMLALGEFARALDDAKEKQLMWARLKQVPPLAEPY